MTTQAQTWVSAFGAALDRGDIPAVTALFHDGGYWRDLLTFTWNIKTMEGRGAIAAMLRETLAGTRPGGWRITEEPEVDGADTHVWLGFETAAAQGIGRVTLRNGLAFTLMTAMADLKGHEEPRGPTRPRGIVHKADRARQTWGEARADRVARLGHQDQPYVLIIGGGQGGLALGARLKQLGVPTLIVEATARAGDAWRTRYRSLVLHDPVWYDHLPYLPFPENWPVFTPKDKMGDWLEAYAGLFELDLWTSTTLHLSAVERCGAGLDRRCDAGRPASDAAAKASGLCHRGLRAAEAAGLAGNGRVRGDADALQRLCRGGGMARQAGSGGGCGKLGP